MQIIFLCYIYIYIYIYLYTYTERPQIYICKISSVTVFLKKNGPITPNTDNLHRTIPKSSQSAGTVECANCISTEGQDHCQWVSWIFGYDTKPFDGEASVIGALGNVEYLFIAIFLRFSLTQNGSTCSGPLYGSNRNM